MRNNVSFLVFTNFINSSTSILNIIYLSIEAAIAVGTIFLAFMAYKQIKESIIARKRAVALDLASIIVCVLAYIKDCYNLENDIINEFNLELCIDKPISMVITDSGTTIFYAISKDKFDRLRRNIINLTLSLADKDVEKKIKKLPEFELIYRETIKECEELRETNIPEHVSKSYNILTSVLKHLIIKYGLSINEIKDRCRELLNPHPLP